MTMTPVSSSSIAAVGYDPVTQTLGVQFTNGGIYYSSEPVPAAEHATFLGAASLGRHFNTHLKRTFGFRKVGHGHTGHENAAAAQ